MTEAEGIRLTSEFLNVAIPWSLFGGAASVLFFIWYIYWTGFRLDPFEWVLTIALIVVCLAGGFIFRFS